MAQDIVSVFAIGRLTRDSELKYTGGGLAIAKFSIACNSRAKKGDEWIDEASFLDVSVFGKSAESLNQYLLKGKQIAVQGRLKQERWESDGQNRSKIVINADNVPTTRKGNKNSQGSGADARNSPSRAPERDSDNSLNLGRIYPFSMIIQITPDGYIHLRRRPGGSGENTCLKTRPKGRRLKTAPFHALVQEYFTSGCHSYNAKTWRLREYIKGSGAGLASNLTYTRTNPGIHKVKTLDEIPEGVPLSHKLGKLKSWAAYTKNERKKTLDRLNIRNDTGRCSDKTLFSKYWRE